MSGISLPDRVAFSFRELPAVTGLPAAFWLAQHAAGNLQIKTSGDFEVILKADVERVLSSLPVKTCQSPQELEQQRIADAKAAYERGRQIASKALHGDGSVDPRIKRGRDICARVTGRRSQQ